MVQNIKYPYPTEKINHFIGYGDSLKMVSKYFQFNKNYLETPFLDTLHILTKSDKVSSYFEIILYTPNSLGIPTYILNHNVIRCNTSKGIHENIIDVSSHRIRFPRQGFFVVIDWRNNESNTSSFTYHKGNKDEKFIGTCLQPLIGTYPSSTSDSFLLSEGGWKEVQKRESIFKDYQDKYHNLAINLELSD